MTMAGFEELDYAMTPLGELILRRREVLSLNRAEVFEVKLAGELLMSSIVNEAEKALAELALPLVTCRQCDVLVGGLGLGYTAEAALRADNVAAVTVIEYLDRVIAWHQGELVPLGRFLTQDKRCRLVHGDFFAAVGSPASVNDSATESGFEAPNPEAPDPDTPVSKAGGTIAASPEAVAQVAAKRFHAILLDIDHSPQSLLQAGHAAFYTSDGLNRLADHLAPGGVFALWSADPPEESLTDSLAAAFTGVQAFEVNFYNPLLDLNDVNYIVVAQRAPAG